jgi:hypothetical protein
MRRIPKPRTMRPVTARTTPMVDSRESSAGFMRRAL